MKKRMISFLMAFMMVATVFVGGTVKIHAAANEGGLLWNYRDVSNSAMTGVTSPARDEAGQFIYMASAKLFYKINAKTGKVDGTVTLSGSVGYNKIAPVVAPSSRKFTANSAPPQSWKAMARSRVFC